MKYMTFGTFPLAVRGNGPGEFPIEKTKMTKGLRAFMKVFVEEDAASAPYTFSLPGSVQSQVAGDIFNGIIFISRIESPQISYELFALLSRMKVRLYSKAS